MSVVEFRDVHFRIGDRTILQGLSLSIEPGETLVLLGRSGSGKTTALRLINGMHIAEDFDAATPFGRRIRTKSIWLDAGSSDPFRAATTEFGRQLGVRVRISKGGHDGDYWDAHMASYLRFYASALARC